MPRWVAGLELGALVGTRKQKTTHYSRIVGTRKQKPLNHKIGLSVIQYFRETTATLVLFSNFCSKSLKILIWNFERSLSQIEVIYSSLEPHSQDGPTQQEKIYQKSVKSLQLPRTHHDEVHRFCEDYSRR
jgi:hypothetical protein